MLPTVVIAGRPNVGKSTLFNKLAGRRYALVADTPGVTRDRKDAVAMLRGREVRLVDTAGLEESAPETLAGRMHASSARAVSQADLVLFVVDARAGITPADAHFAENLLGPIGILKIINAIILFHHVTLDYPNKCSWS